MVKDDTSTSPTLGNNTPDKSCRAGGEGDSSTASTASSFLRSPLFSSLISAPNFGIAATTPTSEIIRKYETSPSVVFREYTSWKETKWGEDNLDEVEFEEDDVNLELSLPSVFTNPLVSFPSFRDVLEDIYARVAAFFLTMTEVAVSARFYVNNPRTFSRAMSSAISVWLPTPPDWLWVNFMSVRETGKSPPPPDKIIRDDWETDDLLDEEEDEQLTSAPGEEAVQRKFYFWQLLIFILGTLAAILTFTLLLPAALFRLVFSLFGPIHHITPREEEEPQEQSTGSLFNRFVSAPAGDTWDFLKQLGTDAAAEVESRVTSGLTAIKNCGLQTIHSFSGSDVESNAGSSKGSATPRTSFSDLKTFFLGSISQQSSMDPDCYPTPERYGTPSARSRPTSSYLGYQTPGEPSSKTMDFFPADLGSPSVFSDVPATTPSSTESPSNNPFLTAIRGNSTPELPPIESMRDLTSDQSPAELEEFEPHPTAVALTPNSLTAETLRNAMSEATDIKELAILPIKKATDPSAVSLTMLDVVQRSKPVAEPLADQVTSTPDDPGVHCESDSPIDYSQGSKRMSERKSPAETVGLESSAKQSCDSGTNPTQATSGEKRLPSGRVLKFFRSDSGRSMKIAASDKSSPIKLRSGTEELCKTTESTCSGGVRGASFESSGDGDESGSSIRGWKPWWKKTSSSSTKCPSSAQRSSTLDEEALLAMASHSVESGARPRKRISWFAGKGSASRK